MHRVHHALLILIGRVPYEYSTPRMELQMALDTFNTKVAELNTVANRVIAQLQASDSSSAQATSDLANADQTASAAIQPIIDALNNAVPPVPTDTPAA